MLLAALMRFVNEETCPVNDGLVPGFISGAFNGWGWARTRVCEIVKNNPMPCVPAEALCFFKDGDKWCCVRGDFVNLQESPAGFGETFEDALNDLSEVESGRKNVNQ